MQWKNSGRTQLKPNYSREEKWLEERKREESGPEKKERERTEGREEGQQGVEQ